MATEHDVSTTEPRHPSASPIENEIAAYRAISPQAIFSLVFGVLTILSVADLNFLWCGVIAVVLGILADRKIQRHPEMLTGRGFAQAGVFIGLVFGLGTLTVTQVNGYIRTASAANFAKKYYVPALKNEPIDVAIWYKQPPQVRKEKSPADVMKQLKSAAKDPQMILMETMTYERIKARLAAAEGENVEFDRIESTTEDGLDTMAGARIKFTGPGSKAFPDKTEFALVVLRGNAEKGWYVFDLKYPYVPKSYTPAPVKKGAEDGHGHSH